MARYGGEEFTLILTSIDGRGANVLAERLRRAIEAKEKEANNLTIKITISIGITTYVPKISTTKKLLLIDTADKALYRSKETGRNKVTFFESPTL